MEEEVEDEEEGLLETHDSLEGTLKRMSMNVFEKQEQEPKQYSYPLLSFFLRIEKESKEELFWLLKEIHDEKKEILVKFVVHDEPTLVLQEM